MTTLAVITTKDALVMGCDSLGTMSKPLIDPLELLSEFFDGSNNWELKKNSDGESVLKSFSQIYSKAQSVPFNHMTHVEKLFSLNPLPMGVMFTGIASLGDRTIRSLIVDFKETDNAFKKSPKPSNFTVKKIAERLLKYIQPHYLQIFPENAIQPPLELMVGGYNITGNDPDLYRINVHEKTVAQVFDDTAKHGIAFGGQMQEIQRIVFGTDGDNRDKIILRMDFLYKQYRDRLQNHLKSKGIEEELPQAFDFGQDMYIFNDWNLEFFDANWGDFSDQNAIECVHFFVEIMVRSQQFSNRMPTVGGDIHIALITKEKGFNFVSKESYEHEGYETPKGE